MKDGKQKPRIYVGHAMNAKVNFFWFRRDLRIEDNAGLYFALSAAAPTIAVFIFDKEILGQLADPRDARVTFLYDRVGELQKEIIELGGAMMILHGNPIDIWNDLSKSHLIDAVYANRDYEPYAKQRDAKISQFLASRDIAFKTFKDHIIFEGNEILKADGLPYTVFTPYSRKWKAAIGVPEDSQHLKSYDCNSKLNGFYSGSISDKSPSLTSLGFKRSRIEIPSKRTKVGIIRSYDKNRDFPYIKGTSKLGVHFRFGTISIREKVRLAYTLNMTFVTELIWRDFYSMILQHFPHVVDGPFRQKYSRIEWINDEAQFQAWCAGKTGYPLVDAGMRELNQTGFMHNRVRMVAASFLTKHLLIDWRWGEAYFAEKLLDYDLASNNGGWQWAAGCGTDAAPYFRIFNPTSQQIKFDKDFSYIKSYVPEYGTNSYPDPIVDHKEARARCLSAYKSGLT